MSLFRSEEHLDRWLTARQRSRGAVLTIQQTWQLARAWYVDPRPATWRPRTKEESQALLASVGLVGEFWEL